MAAAFEARTSSHSVATDAQTEDSPVLEVNGNQYLLTKDKTVIGRGSGCDIVIDDPGISRKHLEIDITDNGVIARDLGSTNAPPANASG